jgi:hypothetical protein
MRTRINTYIQEDKVSSIGTAFLAFYFRAIIRSNYEAATDSYFKVYFDELLSRDDITHQDLRRLVHGCWLQEQKIPGSIDGATWTKLIEKMAFVFEQLKEQEMNIAIYVLDQHILPPFPKDYAKQYIALEQGLLEFKI